MVAGLTSQVISASAATLKWRRHDARMRASVGAGRVVGVPPPKKTVATLRPDTGCSA